MAINGIGGGTSYLALSLVSARKQIEDLQQQLSSGKKSTSYAGMGSARGFAVGLRAQLNSLATYADNMTNTNLRINLADSVLTRMVKLGQETRTAALNAPVLLDNTGQTTAQRTAKAALAEMLQLLNTQSADRYIFSGRAIDQPAVASISDILDGTGAKAGLNQLIAERRAADVGGGLGRVVLSQPTTTSVAVAEDAAGSPFGLKLAGISTTLTGATISAPAGAPPQESIDLGAINPNNGEKVNFTFNMPDGTTETIQLTATTATPPPTGSFTIGADTIATAANLNAALNTAIGKLANTSLVAASAMAASDNFFKDNPPQRVSGTPLATATALVAGTASDTVSWYTGENGSDPARGTAVARIDQTMTVQYGMRAEEEGLRWQVQNLAVFAAVTTPASDPNANAQLAALNQRVIANLADQSGKQSIQDIEAELSGAQSAIKSSQDRQRQLKVMLDGMVGDIEGVTNEEVASKILALQTSLQASYQTTSMLYQLSLVKFL
jgi:flagellin-like hook-associated protein FlgL